MLARLAAAYCGESSVSPLLKRAGAEYRPPRVAKDEEANEFRADFKTLPRLCTLEYIMAPALPVQIAAALRVMRDRPFE
jgi:hypothetical protein